MRDVVADGRGAVRALVTDLGDLALDLRGGGYSPTVMAMFTRDLRRAAPGAVGATVSFACDEPTRRRVEINLVDRTLDAAAIGGGLRIPLAAPIGFEPARDGSVLFYAIAPSAFVDLVTGLLALTYTSSDRIDQTPLLPSDPVSPSLDGIHDFSLVNHALGVLLNRGYTLTEARADLRDRTIRAQTTLPDTARRLLDSYPTRQGTRWANLPPLPVSRSSHRPSR